MYYLNILYHHKYNWLQLTFKENDPVIKISDMKEIMNKHDQSTRDLKISNLKKKIDSIFEEGIWDFGDIFQEFNYFNNSSTVFECVVYFLAG